MKFRWRNQVPLGPKTKRWTFRTTWRFNNQMSNYMTSPEKHGFFTRILKICRNSATRFDLRSMEGTFRDFDFVRQTLSHVTPSWWWQRDESNDWSSERYGNDEKPCPERTFLDHVTNKHLPLHILEDRSNDIILSIDRCTLRNVLETHNSRIHSASIFHHTQL